MNNVTKINIKKKEWFKIQNSFVIKYNKTSSLFHFLISVSLYLREQLQRIPQCYFAVVLFPAIKEITIDLLCLCTRRVVQHLSNLCLLCCGKNWQRNSPHTQQNT